MDSLEMIYSILGVDGFPSNDDFLDNYGLYGDYRSGFFFFFFFFLRGVPLVRRVPLVTGILLVIILLVTMIPLVIMIPSVVIVLW